MTYVELERKYERLKEQRQRELDSVEERDYNPNSLERHERITDIEMKYFKKRIELDEEMEKST